MDGLKVGWNKICCLEENEYKIRALTVRETVLHVNLMNQVLQRPLTVTTKHELSAGRVLVHNAAKGTPNSIVWQALVYWEQVRQSKSNHQTPEIDNNR